MTTLQSIGGSLIWSAVACVLMIVTLTPVEAATVSPADCEVEAAAMCMDIGTGSPKQCPLYLA